MATKKPSMTKRTKDADSAIKRALACVENDLDLDPVFPVLLGKYPTNIKSIKVSFMTFWPLFRQLCEGTASALISCDYDYTRFTSEVIYALWLCGFTSGQPNVVDAWDAAYDYLLEDGNDYDDDDFDYAEAALAEIARQKQGRQEAS